MQAVLQTVRVIYRACCAARIKPLPDIELRGLYELLVHEPGRIPTPADLWLTVALLKSPFSSPGASRTSGNYCP